jgi:small subunit ribosomal protein S6
MGTEVQRKEMTNRNYEALYILPSNYDDAAVQASLDTFKRAIEENGGTVAKAAKWDTRKLAYKIKGHTEGIYCLVEFSAPPTVPEEVRRLFRISDEIIRGRVFLQEE